MNALKVFNWNIGYTTKEHLCIDLDDISQYNAENLAKLLMQDKPEIGSCLVLRSSQKQLKERWIYPVNDTMKKYVNRDSYHLIFNGLISYEESCKIIENLAHLNVIDEAYIRIREMRNDMTIRTSSTPLTSKTKSKPVIVAYIRNPYDNTQKGGIYRFMRLYKLCT